MANMAKNIEMCDKAVQVESAAIDNTLKNQITQLTLTLEQVRTDLTMSRDMTKRTEE